MLAERARADQKRADDERNRRRDSVWAALKEARGPRYAKTSFAQYVCGTPEQEAAKAACMDYAKDIEARCEAGQNVLFIGPAGTGKDHLMFSMAHAAIGKYKTVLWANGTDLWRAFREGIDAQALGFSRKLFAYDIFDGHLHGKEGDIIWRLCEVDVLAISDPVPPGGPLSDWQAANLFSVIDHRYSHLKPTWMTLNCANRAEAEARMGASTVDRLGHDALTVVCDWPSYRRKQVTEGADA